MEHAETEAPEAPAPPMHAPMRPSATEPRTSGGTRGAPVPARSDRSADLPAGRSSGLPASRTPGLPVSRTPGSGAGRIGKGDRHGDRLRPAQTSQDRVAQTRGQASKPWIESLTEAPSSNRRWAVIGTWAAVVAVLLAGALFLWSQRATLPFGPGPRSAEHPAGTSTETGGTQGPASQPPETPPLSGSAPPESLKTSAPPAGAVTPAKTDTGATRVRETTLVPAPQSPPRRPPAPASSRTSLPARSTTSRSEPGGETPSTAGPARRAPGEAPAPEMPPRETAPREAPAPESPAPELGRRVVPGPY